jgi:hypothetical protein
MWHVLFQVGCTNFGTEHGLCSNLKPPMHGRCRDGAKIQRKANRHIFGYLSGFAVLFPFPETRTIKASSCRQAGRGDREPSKSHLWLCDCACVLLGHHTQRKRRETERHRACAHAPSSKTGHRQTNWKEELLSLRLRGPETVWDTMNHACNAM